MKEAMRRTASSVGLCAVLVPGVVAGQAVCSAPHSSPTLAQSGAVGALPQGAGWLQLSLFGQRATGAFNTRGERQPFLANSTFDTRSAYLTGAYGVLEGLELWAQLPVHNLAADGDGGSTTTSGLGDLRAAVRLAPELVGISLPVALRVGVKVPGSDFPVDAIELPLTEGQTDVELSLESGWAAGPSSLYAVGWVGHRWRGPDREARYEPGDERFAHVALGGGAAGLHVELGLDALWGEAPVQQGILVPAAKRRLLQLLPTVGADLGPGRLELTTPIPIAGKNLPSSVGVSVGYRALWGL